MRHLSDRSRLGARVLHADVESAFSPALVRLEARAPSPLGRAVLYAILALVAGRRESSPAEDRLDYPRECRVCRAQSACAKHRVLDAFALGESCRLSRIGRRWARVKLHLADGVWHEATEAGEVLFYRGARNLGLPWQLAVHYGWCEELLQE